MQVNKVELVEELAFIHCDVDFTDDCSESLKRYILSNNMAYYDEDGMLFLTPYGEDIIGYKYDEGYNPDSDVNLAEGFFYYTGDENESD